MRRADPEPLEADFGRSRWRLFLARFVWSLLNLVIEVRRYIASRYCVAANTEMRGTRIWFSRLRVWAMS